jgi:hypothetical protein
MTERYDVQKLRGDPSSPIFRTVSAIVPGARRFHVLAHTPGQGEDLFVVLVDGTWVTRFELPRSTDEAAQAVTVEALADYRKLVGQGRFRMLLDAAVADARKRVTP